MSLLHFIEGSSLHFVLKEIQKFNLQLGVKLGLLEDIELSNNLVKSVNLDLVFHAGGVGSEESERCNDVFEHFLL